MINGSTPAAATSAPAAPTTNNLPATSSAQDSPTKATPAAATAVTSPTAITGQNYPAGGPSALEKPKFAAVTGSGGVTHNPWNNNRVNPVALAIAFVVSYRTRSTDDSQADNFAIRTEPLVTLPLAARLAQEQIDTVADQPANGAAGVNVTHSAEIAESATDIQVLVNFGYVQVNRAGLITSAADGGRLYVTCTIQPDGKWLVSAVNSGGN